MTSRFLPAAESRALLLAVTRGETAEERLRLAEAVVDQIGHIDQDEGLRWDAFVAQYLRDCAEARQPEKARIFLDEPSFSGDEMRALLDPVVTLYLALGEMRSALDWIDRVSAVFGPDTVRHLPQLPGLAALATNKTFVKLTGPEAEEERFVDDLKEALRMWKHDEYDNLKDALLDARDLHGTAARFGAKQEAKAAKHLAAVRAEVARVAKTDPELEAYLKDLD